MWLNPHKSSNFPWPIQMALPCPLDPTGSGRGTQRLAAGDSGRAATMSSKPLGGDLKSWDVMGHLPTNLANQLFWGKSSLKFQPCNISTSQCRCSYSDEDAALTSRTSDRCQKNQQTDPNTKQGLALWTRKPILRTMFAYSRKHILKKKRKNHGGGS